MLYALRQVDENMRRAHKRDAATEGKFFFRSNIDYAQSPEGGADGEIYSPCDNDPQSGLEEMTILEILEGKVRHARRVASFRAASSKSDSE